MYKILGWNGSSCLNTDKIRFYNVVSKHYSFNSKNFTLNQNLILKIKNFICPI